MTWYEKYGGGFGPAGEYTSQGIGGDTPGGSAFDRMQSFAMREKEFEQRMDEMKALDKYNRKQERYERLSSSGGSFKDRKRRNYWKRMAKMAEESPEAFKFYKEEQGRIRAKKAQKAYEKAAKKRRQAQRAMGRSPVGDLDKQQWVGQMGGAQGSRHREYNRQPVVKVGMSGAPIFPQASANKPASRKSPEGGQNQFDPVEAIMRGLMQRQQKLEKGEIEKDKGGPKERQAPRAWAEHQELLGRPSDYRTWLQHRRLRMSTGLQDPMGSAIHAGERAAGVIGQGIERLDPHNPDNIFHSAGEWLGGGGVAPPFWAPPQAPPQAPPRKPISFPPSPHGIGVGGFLPGEPVPPGQRRPHDPIWMG